MVPRHARLEPGQLKRRGQSRERENSTGVADHRGIVKLVKLVTLVMIDHCDDETLLLANWWWWTKDDGVMLLSTLYCRERVVCCSWQKQQLRTQVRLSNNCFLYQHPKWSFSSSWKKFIVSMFQIPRHADRYKFKKVVWFHICNTSLKKFDFICNASNFSSLQAVTHGNPPHYQYW